MRRRDRDETGRFLVEGPQAVREALAAGAVRELFATGAARQRYPELTGAASLVTDDAIAALAETVAPQGLVAVCSAVEVPLAAALAGRPPLVAVLAGIRDPGNAGTVLRTADAAGAGAVVFAGEAVDPYNGKCVRASDTGARSPRCAGLSAVSASRSAAAANAFSAPATASSSAVWSSSATCFGSYGSLR